MNKDNLPAGFTTRGATMDDIAPAVELYNLWSQAVLREDEFSETEPVREEWTSPGFEPENDIRLVFAPDGTMVGYIEVWTTTKPPVHPWVWGRVHPEYSNQGIGTYLLNWAEKRAAQALPELPTNARFAPRMGIPQNAKEACLLAEEMGYKNIRGSFDMWIGMDTPPPKPKWAEGIRMETYSAKIGLEVIYKTYVETFGDHFGFVESPFEEGLQNFRHFMLEADDFDPTLWFIAIDGDEVVGVCLCRPKSFEIPEAGYVHVMGVRRNWRHRGLGLAFLQHAFGEFYRRGTTKVTLGVDAENLTGALGLYEKAGMHVYKQVILYEKEIRAGKEISVQSIQE